MIQRSEGLLLFGTLYFVNNTTTFYLNLFYIEYIVTKESGYFYRGFLVRLEAERA
jgi:hypothetical protein